MILIDTKNDYYPERIRNICVIDVEIFEWTEFLSPSNLLSGIWALWFYGQLCCYWKLIEP